MSKEYMIRVFKRKRVWICLFLTLVINYFDFSQRSIVAPLKDVTILQSAFNENILIWGRGLLGYFLYTFLLFILASICLSDLISEDMETKLINIELTKKKKSKYVRDAYLNNFVIGGFFTLLPIVINLMLWLMIRPMWHLNFINSGLDNHVIFSSIFSKNIFLFYFLVFIKIFVMGGIIASFALFMNTKYKSSYLGVIGVLIIDIIVQYLVSIISSLTGNFISFDGLMSLTTDIMYVDFNIFTSLYLLIMIFIPIIYFVRFSKQRDFI
ncbi:MAG: hypothetical protein PUG67_04895 [Peptoniphilaceae bacterium]|nr:hypothetical protein [Peptoniphilaceae bacterium]MDY6019417.1 hypothetical protein [Anaerococcus sp.]